MLTSILQKIKDNTPLHNEDIPVFLEEIGKGISVKSVEVLSITIHADINKKAIYEQWHWENLEQLAFLKKIAFINCKLANLDLSSLIKLRELTLNSCSIGENVVLNCPNLERFVSNFYNTDVADHIEKFLTEINLVNLKYVEINTFNKKVDGINILKNLATCKEIKTLFIGANIKELPYELMDFPALEEIGLKRNPIIPKYPKAFFHVKGLLKILQEINQKITDVRKRKAYLGLFWKDEAQYNSLTQQDLWQTFQFSDELLQLHASEIVQKKYPSPLAPNFDPSKAIFYLLGKFKGWSSTEIKAALKQQNIQISSKFNEKVTHLLVGNQADKTLQQAIDQKCVLVLPEHLKNYIEKIDIPHLLEAESDIQTSLEALLNSKDENNLLLAFTMMLSGGIPNHLSYHLLILYWSKQITSTKGKETLLELIDKNFPTSLKIIAKKYIHIERYKIYKKVLEEPEISQADFIKAGMAFFKLSHEDFTKTGLATLGGSDRSRSYNDFFITYNSYRLFLKQALNKKYFNLLDDYIDAVVNDNSLTIIYNVDTEIFFKSPPRPNYKNVKSIFLLKLDFWIDNIKKHIQEIATFCQKFPDLEALTIDLHIYSDKNKEGIDLFMTDLKNNLPQVRVNIENY